VKRAVPIAVALAGVAVACSHGRGRLTVGAGAQVAETRDELLVVREWPNGSITAYTMPNPQGSK